MNRSASAASSIASTGAAGMSDTTAFDRAVADAAANRYAAADLVAGTIGRADRIAGTSGFGSLGVVLGLRKKGLETGSRHLLIIHDDKNFRRHIRIIIQRRHVFQSIIGFVSHGLLPSRRCIRRHGLFDGHLEPGQG